MNYNYKFILNKGITGEKNTKCLLCYSPPLSEGNIRLYALLNEKSSLINSESINFLVYVNPTVIFLIYHS